MTSISNGESGSSVRSKLNTLLGGVQYISTTITSAQILNSASVPIEVIPAPGAGKAVQILGCISSLGGAINYGVSLAMILIYGSVFSGAVKATSDDLCSTAGNVQINNMFLNGSSSVTGVRSKWENKSICFSGGSSNPTLGDGDMKLTVTYIVVDV